MALPRNKLLREVWPAGALHLSGDGPLMIHDMRPHLACLPEELDRCCSVDVAA